METIKVLLVDDHPIVRLGVREMLRRAPGIQVAGEAETGAQAIAMAARLQPDVIVLDFELPDMDGAEVARRVCVNFPSVRILALSAHASEEYIRKMLGSGALGYLTKDEASRDIVRAVRCVAQGESWMSLRVARQLGQSRERTGYLEDDLGKDEKEILRWMVAGRTDEQISEILELDLIVTRKTVAAVEAKLGARSREDAISLAIREGII